MAFDDAVAEIYFVDSGGKSFPDEHYTYARSGNFTLSATGSTHGATDRDVPGVVLRAASGHSRFDVARKGLPIWVGDIVKAAPDTVMGLDLVIGGRVAVPRGAAVKMVSDGQALTLVGGEWTKIVLNSGGAWAKFQKTDKPLTIQTRGGVTSIKG